MKKVAVLLLAASLVALVAEVASARETSRMQSIRTIGIPNKYPPMAQSDPGLAAFYETQAVDTYCIVAYNFEVMNWQGWTREDRTAQRDTFFHVDDFLGLAGGSDGRLVPIEGERSIWCGIRPAAGDPYVCGWANAPGYGNNWNQVLTTDAIPLRGFVSFSYSMMHDVEQDYDYVYVEYDAGGGAWQEFASYTGVGAARGEHFMSLIKTYTKLRFRMSSDGAWSDEDGFMETDGACILDSISVTDGGGFSNLELFEAAPVGAVDIGIWHGRPGPAYGMYSGLKSGLVDYDPCGENFGTQVVFFIGSPNPSSKYPGLYDTPFCKGLGGISPPCQFEMVVSPVIDMTKYSTGRNNVQDARIPAADLPMLGGCIMKFTVYSDLPYENLVCYTAGIRKIVNGCPQEWQGDNVLGVGADAGYLIMDFDASTLASGNDPIQIALECIDMCQYWYSPGACAAHTPAPWYDNVWLKRYKNLGPQWTTLDGFQDNFPVNEFDMESFVRADGWMNTSSIPPVRPADSIVVDATSPLGAGIAEDPVFGGPAVYLHVKPTYIGPAPAKPQLVGPTLAGSVQTNADPPEYIDFNYVGDDGTWTVIQCEPARGIEGVVADRYMVDLNDDLFTRGYMIEYYFTARDNLGNASTFPPQAGSEHFDSSFEFTCLPTLNSNVLFVDGGAGQYYDEWWFRDYFSLDYYWRPVFDAVLAPPNNRVDTYDVSFPNFGGSNTLGGRAKTAQLIAAYDIIIWDAGWQGVMADGIASPSNDCQMLTDWMNLSPHACGLWMCGDNIADQLTGLGSLPALNFLNVWCGVDVVHPSYFFLTGGAPSGGVVSPLLTGDPEAGVFVHGGTPDQCYIDGSCYMINSFDVLEKTAYGMHALAYPPHMGLNYYAGISSERTNAEGFPVRTMWFGFSYQYIRDDRPGTPIDRFEIARDVFAWFQSATNADITSVETPTAYRLAQNFPNPFNPSTVIRFDMRDKGLVTVRIFDVSGRLVRTLVSGIKEAGSYSATWDGASDRGAAVASGIYFYKMEAGSFSQTRKLVMLR